MSWPGFAVAAEENVVLVTSFPLRLLFHQQVCGAAVEAGVDVLVLCDTNGGSLTWEVIYVLMADK